MTETECPNCHTRFRDPKGKPWGQSRIEKHYRECKQTSSDLGRMQAQIREGSQRPSTLSGGIGPIRRTTTLGRARASTSALGSHRASSSRQQAGLGLSDDDWEDDTSNPLPSTSSSQPRLSSPGIHLPPHDPLAHSSSPNTSPPSMSMEIDIPPTANLSDGVRTRLGESTEPAVASGTFKTGRPTRKRRLPMRFREPTPVGPNKLVDDQFPDDFESNIDDPSQPPPSHISPHTTVANIFGIFRQYFAKPSDETDVQLSERDFYDTRKDAGQHPVDSGQSSSTTTFDDEPSTRSPIWPFNNLSELLFLNWFHNGKTKKSIGERTELVNSVFGNPYFDASEVTNTSLKAVEAELGRANEDPSHPLYTGSAWKQRSVAISIPRVRESPVSFHVPGLVHRSITKAVIASLQKKRPPASALHYTPFKSFWKSPTDACPANVERVYDELYSSNLWWREHKKIQELPPETNEDGSKCTLERAIAGVMLWSDAAQLGNFGNAKIWPVYMFLGNQSKFQRNKGSARECNHIAYIPSLPDALSDYLKGLNPPIATSSNLKAHLRRELFHAVWNILLDSELVQAYVHGIPVLCGDGVRRRIYIRIFTYSADYPEKALIALIRDNGLCPCPLCQIRREDISKLGTKGEAKRIALMLRRDDQRRRDLIWKARKLIYAHPSVSLGSTRVEALLKRTSLVPTLNAFSEALGEAGFDFHEMIVPDIMHENLLGTWKALLLVILRLLYALNPTGVAEFNKRFRGVPTFGRDTIRKFSDNVAETKSMTAARYQDVLLCIIPVVEDLIPQYDVIVREVLFCAANWLSMAKLHMHSEATLDILRQLTQDYGSLTRRLASRTADVALVETPREVRVRQRREAASGTASSSAPKPKPLTNNTYKYHMMSHIVLSIMFWGTLDSFTTAIGETEHKTSKSKWQLSNHHNFEMALGKTLTLRELIARLFAQFSAAVDYFFPNHSSRSESHPPLGDISLDAELMIEAEEEEEAKNLSNGLDDYGPKVLIGRNQNSRISIQTFLGMHENDPAIKDFLPKFKDHILIRLGYAKVDDEISDEQRRSVYLVNGSLFPHKTARVNYTTYDVHRAQDTIHCTTPDGEKCNVMVYAHDEDAGPSHPFWYARVLMIFSAQVSTPDYPHGLEMRFFWVRWFGRDLSTAGGWKSRRLDRIGFLEDRDEQFGFLDPDDVIRAVHLIPAFAHGRTKDLLRRSKFRSDQGDWQYYYVNRFADRDMMMRYTDLAIGHVRPRSSEPLSTREWVDGELSRDGADDSEDDAAPANSTQHDDNDDDIAEPEIQDDGDGGEGEADEADEADEAEEDGEDEEGEFNDDDVDSDA